MIILTGKKTYTFYVFYILYILNVLHYVDATNEWKVICTLPVSCWNVVRNEKYWTLWWIYYFMHLPLPCVSYFRLKHCRYGSQNKPDMLPETQHSKNYGGSWRRGVKIWIISKDTVTNIWMREVETFIVLVSGWYGQPCLATTGETQDEVANY